MFFRLSAPNLTEIPTSPSTKRVTEKLHETIADGYYKLDYLIVPQKFEKITLKDGKIQKEEIEVCGRKINLLSIRNDMYHQQKKHMRLRPDIYFDTLSPKLKRLMNLTASTVMLMPKCLKTTKDV